MLADYVVPARIARMSRRRMKRALIADLQSSFDAKRLPLPWPYEACKVRAVRFRGRVIDYVDVWVEPPKPVEAIDIDLVKSHPASDFVSKT